jgi:hypothetical protein
MDRSRIWSLQSVPVLLLPFLVSCASPPAAQVAAPRMAPAVFILAGQSNMAGRGVTSDLPEDLRHAPPRVRFILSGEERDFGDQQTFGPEVGFAHSLAEAWPEREIVLIKHAVGATSLLAWAPTWDSAQAERTRNASVGPLYNTLLTQVRGAGLPVDSEILGILWMQGERDANYPEVADSYEANLGTLIQAFRQDLAASAVPFFLGQINPPSTGWTASARVRAAQEAAAEKIPGTVLIRTDDLSKREDEPIHYDGPGLLRLGSRFAAAVVRYYSGRYRGNGGFEDFLGLSLW